MQALICPNCNAKLDIRDTNRGFAFCEYCGEKVLLDNYRVRIIDEAKLKQLELEAAEIERKAAKEEAQKQQEEECERQRQKELIVLKRKYKKSLRIIWLGCIVFSLISFFIMPVLPLMLILITAAIHKYLRQKYEDNKTKITCGDSVIHLSKRLFPVDGFNYRDLEKMLREMGFHRIICKSLHDVTTLGTIFGGQRRDQVSELSINGKVVANGGGYYSPEAEIVIEYHGR